MQTPKTTMEASVHRGRLYYVIGPSGAGKDSILTGARRRLEGREPILFARRCITRPLGAGGEDHVELTAEEFEQGLATDAFLLVWRSHGHWYGVGREVEVHLREGLDVAVNGSRGYLEEARRRVPILVPIGIRVSPERLSARLRSRGRETPPEIARRIERAAAFPFPADAVIIDNDGPLEQAVESFCRLVRERRRAVT